MNSLHTSPSHREAIAGIPCDFLSSQEYQDVITLSLASTSLTHIVTLNAEMVVAAQHNTTFRDAMESAELIIPDSSGILWAREYKNNKKSLFSFLFFQATPLTGVDSIFTICEAVEKLQGTIYLVGGEDGDRKQTSVILQKKYSGIKIIHVSTSLDLPFPKKEESAIFVALGAPKQTLWIKEHRAQLEQAGIRIAVGVGGAFAMISGRLPRAPRILRTAHLEWLWRLFLEPKRIQRIWNAVVVFPRLISGYPH